MSRRQMAMIGLTAPAAPDVLPGHDVDVRTGRLLTVVELQRALTVALSAPDGLSGDVAPSDPPAPGADPRGETDRHHGGRARGGIGRHAAERSWPSTPDGPAPAPGGPVGPGSATGEAPEHSAAGTAGPPPGRRWGAAPVPVGSTGDRPVPVDRTGENGAAAQAAGWWPRFPAGELLTLPAQDRGRRAGQVLAAGWVGSRRVLVASLSGGVGRSTVAAAVATAAATAGVAVLLLDATGLEESPAAVRVAANGVSRRPWTWAVDPESAVHLAALRRRAAPPTVPVVALTGDRGTTPPADAVAAAAAAASGFPLVVVDLPAGAPAARAAVRADGPPGLLVLVCRPDPVEIDAAAELVQQLDGPGRDVDGTGGQRSVLVVAADRRGLSRPVRRRLAAAARSVAGVVVVPRVPALVARGAAVNGQAAVLSVGAALAAAGAGAGPDDRSGEEGVAQC